MSETPRYGQLELDVAVSGASIVIRVSGEVDLSNAERFEEAIQLACTDGGDRNVLVDLSELSFIDSTGLRVLIEATRNSRSNGDQLHFRGPSPQVRRILEVTGIFDYLFEGTADVVASEGD